MKQNQGNRGSHGSRESHEVIAVGRGLGKSHENNEDTDSVQGDHASLFSEIILQAQYTALHEVNDNSKNAKYSNYKKTIGI
ncbi:3862_t:CDS:2 [Entrophospora sp. SA101]|nr:3862_t:CDS:2 [Entrophospora sp. SA101]